MFPDTVEQEVESRLFHRSESDRKYGRELIGGRASTRTIVLDFDFVLAHASELKLRNSITRTSTRDLKLERIHTLAATTASNLEHAHTVAHTFNPYLASVISSAIRSANTLACSDSVEPPLVHDLDLNLAHVRNSISALANAHTRDSGLNVAFNLAGTIAEVSILASRIADELTDSNTLKIAQDEVLDRALNLAGERRLFTLSWKQWLFLRIGLVKKEVVGKRQRDIDTLLETYMDLVILEKRIREEFPACEGILIVREDKTESTS